MSDNVKYEELWLIGAGQMAMDYANVLMAMDIPFTAIGRSKESAKTFAKKVNHAILPGGIENAVTIFNRLPRRVIIAVDICELSNVANFFLKNEVKNILLEKPGGLNREKLESVAKESGKVNANVYVAYNRRFYTSTLTAQKMIEEDGGVTSFFFEFSEWAHEIEKLNKSEIILKNWFLGNSSHVLDLAFFLGGIPAQISSYTSGELSWYPTASEFTGAGISECGTLFSYHANWKGPGRWGVEILTQKRRLIFRPMEQLHIQNIGSAVIEKVEIDDSLDKNFKPGLFLQTKAFMEDDYSQMLSVDEQINCLNWYEKIERGFYCQ